MCHVVKDYALKWIKFVLHKLKLNYSLTINPVFSFLNFVSWKEWWNMNHSPICNQDIKHRIDRNQAEPTRV